VYLNQNDSTRYRIVASELHFETYLNNFLPLLLKTWCDFLKVIYISFKNNHNLIKTQTQDLFEKIHIK
jgi:hypothetical protein